MKLVVSKAFLNHFYSFKNNLMPNLNERFKPLKDFPAYLISEDGEVFYKTKKELITPRYQGNGYLTVHIHKHNCKKKAYLLHRLVAETFIWNRLNKPFVNHKDGVKDNPKFSNLEWCTAKENTEHALRYGLVNHKHNIGTKNKIAKLNEKQVIKIRQLHNKGAFQHILAERFGVTQANINLIVNNKAWKHLPQF